MDDAFSSTRCSFQRETGNERVEKFSHIAYLFVVTWIVASFAVNILSVCSHIHLFNVIAPSLTLSIIVDIA